MGYGRSTMDRTASIDVSAGADNWPLSARDAAVLLDVSDRTIRRAIARGELRAVMHAGVYRISQGRSCGLRAYAAAQDLHASRHYPLRHSDLSRYPTNRRFPAWSSAAADATYWQGIRC